MLYSLIAEFSTSGFKTNPKGEKYIIVSRSLRWQYEISFQFHTVPGEQACKSGTVKAIGIKHWPI